MHVSDGFPSFNHWYFCICICYISFIDDILIFTPCLHSSAVVINVFSKFIDNSLQCSFPLMVFYFMCPKMSLTLCFANYSPGIHPPGVQINQFLDQVFPCMSLMDFQVSTTGISVFAFVTSPSLLFVSPSYYHCFN